YGFLIAERATFPPLRTPKPGKIRDGYRSRQSQTRPHRRCAPSGIFRTPLPRCDGGLLSLWSSAFRAALAAASEGGRESGCTYDAVRVGEISDFIDDQQCWRGVVAQASAQGGVAVERGEFAEQLARAGEQHGMAVDQRFMGEIAGQGGFADAVRADQQGVGGILQKLEGHQRLEGRP